MSNTYIKYCPNVFLAKCDEAYERGDIIQVETKYGKENDSIIFNLVYQKDGFYYYSIIRADGFNSQVRAENKVDKYKGYAINATNRANNFQEKSHKDSRFLELGEPIKIGHHSENRHRATIERNWNNMSKSLNETERAEQYIQKANYWAKKQSVVDLSMPESIEYFEFKLEEAKIKHEGLKNGTIERSHGMSLQYAKKDVNELQKKLDIAIKLWA